MYYENNFFQRLKKLFYVPWLLYSVLKIFISTNLQIYSDNIFYPTILICNNSFIFLIQKFQTSNCFSVPFELDQFHLFFSNIEYVFQSNTFPFNVCIFFIFHPNILYLGITAILRFGKTLLKFSEAVKKILLDDRSE